MDKVITPLVSNTVALLKLTRNTILPFTEQPRDEQPGTTCMDEKNINAATLFSLFTADIIKEQVVFTR